eukprot:m.61670 g.61670  ORF g.61670 m.61670 type:complete len:459 (+) comp9572_c0_seq1:19-1395(+)
MGTLRVVAALGALACSSRRTYGALLPKSLVIASVSPEDVDAGKFDVTTFGAKGDGVHDDTEAIQNAYAACAAAGGGTVLFPPDRTFITGPLSIRCNDSVTYLSLGATVLARNTTENWPFGPDCPEPAQGRTPKQAAPLFHLAYGKNVTVTGGGTLNANGQMFWAQACGNWWCPPGYPKLQPKAFRPYLFRIDNSVGVTIANISMKNPGFWNLVTVHSQKIAISDVSIEARWPDGDPHAPSDPYRTPNTDGIEPMWSSDVTVRRASILNGDDCITIKSGSRDILVEDLYCEHGDGLTIGSVWYDDVVNVTYRRVVMNQTHNGPMVKGRSQGNATVRDILFEDVTLIDVFLAVTVDCVYETQGSVVPNIGVQVTNVTFKNVTGSVVPKSTAGEVAEDPTFLTDAAGTFICYKNRPCTVSMQDVDVWHANKANPTPPAWLCGNTTVVVGIGGVHPALSGGC